MNKSAFGATATAALVRSHGAKALAAAGLMAGAVLVVDLPAARADALSTPAMSASVAANPDPISFDGGPIGTIYVGGNISGFASWQASRFRSLYEPQPLGSAFYDDRDFRWDVSNAQVFLQKNDGPVQFFVQAGAYDILAVGYTTFSVGTYTADTYGALPVAYLKLAPIDNFSIEAGKLPSLIAEEQPFDFQNLNIERGLLWLQEPAISRGVQANYTRGPLALSASFNDGYYSDTFDWVSGRLTWTIDPINTLAFAGGGYTASQLPHFDKFLSPTAGTPLTHQNSSIFNLVYTYSKAPWTISPYIEYSCAPRSAKIGFVNTETSWSGALLLDYKFDPSWNVAFRGEYIRTGGKYDSDPVPIATYLLYGPRSRAWSLTLTPTYQYKVFYARAEASYVSSSNIIPTFAWFGFGGEKNTQLRGIIEAGVQF